MSPPGLYSTHAAAVVALLEPALNANPAHAVRARQSSAQSAALGVVPLTAAMTPPARPILFATGRSKLYSGLVPPLSQITALADEEEDELEELVVERVLTDVVLVVSVLVDVVLDVAVESVVVLDVEVLVAVDVEDEEVVCVEREVVVAVDDDVLVELLLLVVADVVVEELAVVADEVLVVVLVVDVRQCGPATPPAGRTREPLMEYATASSMRRRQ